MTLAKNLCFIYISIFIFIFSLELKAKQFSRVNLIVIKCIFPEPQLFTLASSHTMPVLPNNLYTTHVTNYTGNGTIARGEDPLSGDIRPDHVSKSLSRYELDLRRKQSLQHIQYGGGGIGLQYGDNEVFLSQKF